MACPFKSSFPMQEKPKTLTSLDGKPVYCLYITNVPINAKHNDLLAFFNQFGSVKSFYLKLKVDMMKKSTFCFVTYETPEQACQLFKKKHLMFRNRKLYVSIADSWHQPIVGSDGTVTSYCSRGAKIGSTFQMNAVEEIVAHMDLKNKESEEEKEEDEEEEKEEDEEEEEGPSEPVSLVQQISPITRLNEDCLWHIFNFLPFSSRHILSLVCSRWRQVMDCYWSKFTRLDFSAEPWNDMAFSDKRLTLYLSLCPNLNSVHLTRNYLNDLDSIHPNEPTSKSIAITASLGPKLKELSLVGIPMKGRSLAYLSHACPQLNSLSIKECLFDSDFELGIVMKKCHNLESLSIYNCDLFPGDWLKNLRFGLKSFTLFNCSLSSSKHLIEGLIGLKESLVDLTLLTDSRISLSVLTGFTRLQSLTITSDGVGVIPGMLQCCTDNFPKSLTGLKKLELESSALFDSFFTSLVQSCPTLHILNLSHSQTSTLSLAGLRELLKLTELRELNLSHIRAVTDDLLEDLATHLKSLQILSLNCTNISDTGTKRLVKELLDLQELSCNFCHDVTECTVQAAFEAASANPDKQKLVIKAQDTGISEWGAGEKNQMDHRVKVVMDSEPRRRPDISDVFNIDNLDLYGYEDEDSYDDAPYDCFDMDFDDSDVEEMALQELQGLDFIFMPSDDSIMFF